MRYSIAALAPFVAAVCAQNESPALIPVSVIGSGTTASTVYTTYSNEMTLYLTQTNSDGVVTGMPKNTAVAVTSQPAADTVQPPVATIPAGLPAGLHTLAYGNMTSFTVSVGGTTTTAVLGAAPTGIATGSEPQVTGGSDDSDSNASGASGSGSNASSTSEGAGAVATAATGLLAIGAAIAFAL